MCALMHLSERDRNPLLPCLQDLEADRQREDGEAGEVGDRSRVYHHQAASEEDDAEDDRYPRHEMPVQGSRKREDAEDRCDDYLYELP